MAKNILASGRKVIGWDRNPEALEDFVAAGGTPANGLSDLTQCPIVISIVFDDAATRDVTYGSEGLLENLAPGATHIVMASISPDLSNELAKAHEEKGQHYLAASVFGRPEVAAAAKLNINCSGERGCYDAAVPVLNTLGTPLWLGTEPHQAMLLKSVGNSMITVAVQLLREMFATLKSGGVEEAITKRALIDTLFACPIYQGYAQLYIDNPEILKMTDIARKDRNTCLAAAKALGVEMPVVQYLADSDLP